jgi:trehalose 6-phosphate phosphatase
MFPTGAAWPRGPTIKCRGDCTFVKNILAKAQTAVLSQCGTSNALLVFDFDGTLAPLGKDSRSVQLRAATRRALAELAARYPTAVISGRARADVLARLGGIALRAVVGNHGLEPSPRAPQNHALLKTWLPMLRNALSSEPDLSIENKLYSVSIHYGKAKNQRRAQHAIRRAVAELGRDALALPADGAIDIIPADAAHRGSAVASLCKTLGLDSAIYVGRDACDEHAFTPKANGTSLMAIRVGRAAGNKADYYVPTQADVERLLKDLLRARPSAERLAT